VQKTGGQTIAAPVVPVGEGANLHFDGVNVEFVNTASAAPSIAIDDLTDVDTDTNAPSVGDMLVWDGTNWVPALAGGGINSQTGTTYTVALTDNKKTVDQANAAAITTTYPPNASVALPVDAVIAHVQSGAGQITFAAGAGVNFRLPPDTVAKTRGQWSTVTMWQRAVNEWVLSGDLEAAP
jgi:hypothetical protein